MLFIGVILMLLHIICELFLKYHSFPAYEGFLIFIGHVFREGAIIFTVIFFAEHWKTHKEEEYIARILERVNEDMEKVMIRMNEESKEIMNRIETLSGLYNGIVAVYENMGAEVKRDMMDIVKKSQTGDSIATLTTYEMLPAEDRFDMREVVEGLQKGVKFRILWAHPDEAERRRQEGHFVDTLSSTFLASYIKSLQKSCNRDELVNIKIKLYTCLPPFYVFLSKAVAYIGFFPIGQDGRSVPLMKASGLNTIVGNFVMEQFETIWNEAEYFIDLNDVADNNNIEVTFEVIKQKMIKRCAQDRSL
jgi:hypothetical protein